MKDFRHLEPIDYLTVLWRRKWYFLATATLVGAGATAYAWRQPLVYRSETRILVEPPPVPDDIVRSTVRGNARDRINAIRSQVQSRSFMERLIEQYRLQGYGSDLEFSMERAVEAVRKNILINVVLEDTFTLSFAATDPQTARDITQRLADMLVQASSAARRSRAVAADRFVDEQLRKAESDLLAHEEKMRQFKMQHLGALPEQSAANVNALNGLATQLSAVENAIQRAVDQRKLLEFRRQEQKKLDGLARNLLSSMPAAAPAAPEPKPVSALESQLAAKKAALAELRFKYTESHPDIVRLTKEVEELERKALLASAPADHAPGSGDTELTPLGPPERSGDTAAAAGSRLGAQIDATSEVTEAEFRLQNESLGNEIAKLEREKEEVKQQMKVVQSRLNLTPTLEEELLAMSRAHSGLLGRFNDLRNKKYSTQMATVLETDRSSEFYRIIDPATLPETPLFPNRPQIVAIGIAAGFLLGIGAAMGREYLDPTLGSEEEAVTVLQLPVLASVPEIPPDTGKGGPVSKIKSAA
jgi:polysaccharide chain length determinant protein (PEP-CTERM system associated)